MGNSQQALGLLLPLDRSHWFSIRALTKLVNQA